MKQLFLNLLVLIIIIPINDVRSQDEYMLQIIKEQLGKSDIKKIEKAEKYIVSANEQINEAKTLENSGKSNNKSLNKKIKASTELGDAHKIIYDVYLENVEKYAKISSSENAQKANKNIGDDYKLIKEAKKKRETSLRINVLENAYNVLEQACNLEKKAIVNLAETYILLSGKKNKIMNNDVVKSENEEPLNSKEKLTEDKSNKNEQVKIEENKTSEIENNKNIITNVKSSNEENKTSDVVTELNEQDIKGVFFKIQIAASKTPLSVEQLNSIYKTNEIFNVEKDGEWYKYTVVQKFATFDEALAYKN